MIESPRVRIERWSSAAAVLLGLLSVILALQQHRRFEREAVLTENLMACEDALRQPEPARSLTLDFVPDLRERPLTLVTFLGERGCGPYLDEQVAFLNRFSRRFSQGAVVYYAGSDPEALRRRGAAFGYGAPPEGAASEVERLSGGQPMTLVVDRGGRVQRSHRSASCSVEEAKAFHADVESLFESVYR